MNLQELQQQIINKNIDNLYVFTGEEIAVQKIYINKIAEIKNLEIQYVDEYKKILNSIGVNHLFGVKKLYVILDDLDILKQESVWQEIKANGNILIFKYNNLDKRGKFYKHFENKVVEFNKLSEEILLKYIKKEVPLSDNNCNKLIDICDGNYNRILLEIDKIKNFEDARFQDSFDQIFEVLCSLDAFHKEVSDITFEFIDAVVTRNINKIAKLHKEWKRQNDSCLGILSLMYNNLKTILLIQSCKSNDICKTTGLQSNQVYYNKDKTGYYSTGELVRALRIIQKVDTNIKTGLIDEQIALDYVLVNII